MVAAVSLSITTADETDYNLVLSRPLSIQSTVRVIRRLYAHIVVGTGLFTTSVQRISSPDPDLDLIDGGLLCQLHRALLAGPHSTPKSSSQRVSSVSRASVQQAWTAACCLFRSASSVSDSIGGFKPYRLLPPFGWPLLDLSGPRDLVFQVFESTSELSVPLKR